MFLEKCWPRFPALVFFLNTRDMYIWGEMTLMLKNLVNAISKMIKNGLAEEWSPGSCVWRFWTSFWPRFRPRFFRASWIEPFQLDYSPYVVPIGKVDLKKNVSIHKLFLSFPNKGGCSICARTLLVYQTLDGYHEFWFGDPGILENVGRHSGCGTPPQKPFAVGKVWVIGKQQLWIHNVGTNILQTFVRSSWRVEAAFARFRPVQTPVPSMGYQGQCATGLQVSLNHSLIWSNLISTLDVWSKARLGLQAGSAGEDGLCSRKTYVPDC